ncbi:MAG TPA: presenilin family intramembrane aspartyl protease PSH [Candidatus Nanoarchaeia archaeon]|nr:presenilin family intramembrane aspartyl protease PSH [Candidatus Nanoarchaeia archaeon]
MTKTNKKENTLADLLPFIAMGIFLVLVQVISIMLAQPMIDKNFQFTEDTGNIWNAVYYIGLILLFTLFILYAMKKQMKWVIHGVILFAVVSTLYYVFFAIFANFTDDVTNFWLTLVISFLLTVLMYKFPEWYVIDIIGILIGAGVVAIFGISFEIIPTIVLLILLAVYDAISVYQTKHMLVLAEGIMDMKMPILFVIPRHLDFSFLTYKYDAEGEREAFFMGLGDAIMPTILVVSANVFYLQVSYIDLPLIGVLNYPALGAALGTIVGFCALMMLVAKGKPQAGLPFLNTGAILGYAIGCIAAGVPIIPL